MTQTTIQFEHRVNDRIAALLARCEKLTRGSDLHTTFNAAGQRHAEAIAAADRVANRDGKTRGVGRFQETPIPKP